MEIWIVLMVGAGLLVLLSRSSAPRREVVYLPVELVPKRGGIGCGTLVILLAIALIFIVLTQHS